MTEGDGDVGPIAPEDGDIVLDTAEITLGTDRSIRGALQRSARAIAAGAPPPRRLARRGVIMPAAVVGLALPTAVLMALVRPGLTGAAIAVAIGASGLAVAAATSARSRAAIVVAADAAFDGRPIAARRALAAADRHWALLAVWALVDPVVRWSVPLLEHGGKAVGIADLFEVRVDGVVAAGRGLQGRPAPDTFLAAAAELGLAPAAAAVFEDALTGVAAGRAGGFGYVVGVDRVGQADELRARGADVVVGDLSELLDPDPTTPATEEATP